MARVKSVSFCQWWRGVPGDGAFAKPGSWAVFSKSNCVPSPAHFLWKDTPEISLLRSLKGDAVSRALQLPLYHEAARMTTGA